MTDMAVRVHAQTSVMTPVPYRVRSRVLENADSVTLDLEPVGPALPEPAPGEFNMLYAFGVGEIAISVSGLPGGVGLAPLRPVVLGALAERDRYGRVVLIAGAHPGGVPLCARSGCLAAESGPGGAPDRRRSDPRLAR